MQIAVVPLLAFLILIAPAAHAQVAAPDTENGRFTFNQVADGLLRLDTRSGHVSLCSQRVGGWACQAVPDDRAVLEGEIGRLQNENALLKREMIARGVPLPGGLKADKVNPQIELKLPSDADVERVMSFFEKVWRRLVEMVQNIQRDMDKKT
jgi:hypothetical protein